MSEEGQAIAFEDALKRLEEVVGRLETGELDLEQSLSDFEEGVRLVKVCSQRLDAARLRIRKLEQGQDGPVERDANAEEQGS